MCPVSDAGVGTSPPVSLHGMAGFGGWIDKTDRRAGVCVCLHCLLVCFLLCLHTDCVSSLAGALLRSNVVPRATVTSHCSSVIVIQARNEKNRTIICHHI